jgi:hypothetical protein
MGALNSVLLYIQCQTIDTHMQIKQKSLKMHRNAKKQQPTPMLLKTTLIMLIFLQNSEVFPCIQTECHCNFVKIREILSKSVTTFHCHILNSHGLHTCFSRVTVTQGGSPNSENMLLESDLTETQHLTLQTLLM